ncbi:MAG: hypothetical protein AB7F35_01505 [Acetobacteraceae bacterium]
MRRLLPAVLLLGGTAATARTADCDLDQVIGYQLVTRKTIEAHIDAGRRQRGYHGCVPDRVLVFTDNTGVRCKSTTTQALELPPAYLFARSPTDLKLCVGDEMMDVLPAR